MSYELFIDIHEEQQQIVTGGSMAVMSLPNLQGYNYSSYQQDMQVVQFNTKVTSGPNGSSSTKVFQAINDHRLSSAGDMLTFRW
ncbi:hypothetical protein H6G74_17850 [Nostoc spongiaeforme FACHB-130]|uniref:Uncharacterized protein n=1 Tax=Nostoc spongiaeforme FACHB-130 TaxID=1357510 RepID=A0ABR8FXM6_9NOSO|nr:CTB family bacteriocin [Nostoc spongiaeforme]MBD2596175.1 hypothetical protein [Nostoc spongiaeforme FACHB-130]